MSPLVTVLMPAYNAAQYIEEAVASVLDQTMADFELLVIDDGSTDNTLTRLENFRDPRIVVEALPENIGIVGALNRGLELARGTFIARMDADDVADPDRFDLQCAFLNANPNVGVLGSDFESFGEAVGSTSPSWVRWTDPADLRIALLFENPICHPSVMMRSSVLGLENYPSEFPHAEEYALWVRLASRSDLANLPRKLLQYRIHPNQVSRRKSDEQCASIDRLIIAQLSELGLRPSTPELRLHQVLGSAFHPVPGLSRALGRWCERLQEANNSSAMLDSDRLAFQLDSRRKDAVARTGSILGGMPCHQRLGWWAGAWMRSHRRSL